MGVNLFCLIRERGRSEALHPNQAAAASVTQQAGWGEAGGEVTACVELLPTQGRRLGSVAHCASAQEGLHTFGVRLSQVKSCRSLLHADAPHFRGRRGRCLQHEHKENLVAGSGPGLDHLTGRLRAHPHLHFIRMLLI